MWVMLLRTIFMPLSNSWFPPQYGPLNTRRYDTIVIHHAWDIVWFILISLWVLSQLFFLFKGAINWLVHHQFVLEHWALPNRSTSLDPKLHNKKQIYSPIAHLFSLYTSELNFGRTIWEKSEVLLGISWGTLWEQIGNMEKTQKIPPPHPSAPTPPSFLLPALLTSMLLPPSMQ